MSEAATKQRGPSRRGVLKFGAAGAAAAAAGAAYQAAPGLKRRGLLSKDGVFEASSIAVTDSLYIEAFPTSPLILNPFSDPMPIPKAAKPISAADYSTWSQPPGPGLNQQNSLGNETHQKWPSDVKAYDQGDGLGPRPLPDPIVYKFDVKSGQHSFTTSQVLPIDNNGQPTVSYDAAGSSYPAGTTRTLPATTIWGFADGGYNGGHRPDDSVATFPGPRVNAEYGRPVLIRFENHITQNDIDEALFGAPDGSFLTHLHNAHTAPESDGNPHYAMQFGPRHEGYKPGTWVDNLYLNWPAGNDDREKQTFFWFHDHRMDHTGSNVYKGMVGLYPIYDPKGNLDAGDETQGYRLPGVRTNNPDGSFDVDYDIPFALYDVRLDDGVTVHKDFHDGNGEFPLAGNPKTHPENWGKAFFKHFPNHGFVGDIFTVNGIAYPVLEVKRRKYRFRFLDCSIARIYELKLMSSSNGPKAAKDLGYGGDELQGQYRLPDGQQCMKWTQIASDGGLVQFPFQRDSFELWPAKRREFIVDFTAYMDGTPTQKGDAIYLTNIMKMPDGRMWSNSSRFSLDPNYKIPLVKIVIGDDVPDNSQIPTALRELPPLPADWQSLLNNRLVFEVQRGGAGGELEWLINGVQFDPTKVAVSLKNPAGAQPLAQQPVGSFALWEIRNGGGGWVHPFHLHMEEHRVVMRNGVDVTKGDPNHPDDVSREDLVALDPGESVIVYRGFRDFVGPYVAHCHNLAHEDHAMMFGWSITPAVPTGSRSAPTISAITPTTAPIGSTISVTGTGLSTANFIAFSGAAAFAPTAVSDTEVRAVVPRDAVTGPIKVTTPAGSVTSSMSLTVTPPTTPLPPLISAVSPSTGSAGTLVTVTGSALTGTTRVTFGGVASPTVTVLSDTALTAVVPTAAVTGAVGVTTPAGSTSGALFTLADVPKPTISGITPASGPVGTQVAITGTNLAGATSVTFGGVAATFSATTTKITAVVPSGAKTGPITVVAPGGTVTSTATFTVTLPPPPTIAGFTPSSGKAGTTVTLVGTNLASTSSVSLSGVAVSFQIQSSTQLQLVIPKTKTGKFTVVTPYGTVTSASSFTVK